MSTSDAQDSAAGPSAAPAGSATGPSAPGPAAARPGSAACTLVVDLDGTLVATDCLWESMLLLCRRSPRDAAKMPMWLAKGGRAHLKQQIAERVTPNAVSLPYRPEVLEFLREQKSAGRRIVLATASHSNIANAVAQHLGLFDGVLASNGADNVKGSRKLALIQSSDCGEFEYIGDSAADLPVWDASAGAYLVNPSKRLLEQASQKRPPRKVFRSGGGLGLPLLKAMRPRQWVKNALVLLPLVLAHAVRDGTKFQNTCMAFLAFCLCASAIYLVNDLLDIEADRAHPRKRSRPFAAGILPIPTGLIASISLVLVSMLLAACVNRNFFLSLMLYAILTTAYSFYVKGKLLLDVILLAGLYTLRIIAGAMAAEVELTPWLLAFSMFFFISMAFAKRYSELTLVQLAHEEGLKGRSYRVDDLEVILSVGPTSGYLSVVVLCLYISSPTAVHLYRHPNMLWLICPVLLYWITRIWFFARRHALVDDPVLFAMRDRVSWIAAFVTLGLMVLAVR